MSTMASQITSLTIVYSTVYSGANQRKHQSSASLAFVRGIYRGPVNSPHKWSVTRKMFPFDDVIMRVIFKFDSRRPNCACNMNCVINWRNWARNYEQKCHQLAGNGPLFNFLRVYAYFNADIIHLQTWSHGCTLIFVSFGRLKTTSCKKFSSEHMPQILSHTVLNHYIYVNQCQASMKWAIDYLLDTKYIGYLYRDDAITCNIFLLRSTVAHP